MTNPNLVLTFKMAEANDVHVQTARGIRLDGNGLVFYDAQSGRAHKIDMGSLETLHLMSIPDRGRLSSALAIAV